jgi:Mlc titration factor MtfA (ptsG expression regulator)
MMLLAIKVLITMFLIYLLILFAFRKKKEKVITPLPENYKELLHNYVKFYRQLNEEGKEQFEKRVEQFLAATKITGVNATVEDLDIILIAAGAIIPVFAINDWQYINLHEVLVYPGTFNEDFDQEGTDRYISGMVGTGGLQNMMILTKWQLRQGFIDNNSPHNTAIHEFAHLVDKMDGSIDGIPEIILDRKHVEKWKQLMDSTIQHMHTNFTDIPIYGAKNPVEFFAVITEYFFEQPHHLKNHHPDLYEMLAIIYKVN